VKDWLFLLSPWLALVGLIIWDTREKPVASQPPTWKSKRWRIAYLAVSCLLGAFASFMAWAFWTPDLPPLSKLSKAASEPFTPLARSAGLGVGSYPYGACFRILAIDGGGVRGVIPARILAEIEERTQKPISEQFDLIAGTSTGALLALGLTRPSDADARKPAFRANEFVDLYLKRGRDVFPTSFGLLRTIRSAFSPKYGAVGLESVLQQYFGDVQLEEALTRVLVPIYEIEDHKRIWFDSADGRYYGLYMRDIARGATAAPSYLPPARFAAPLHVSSKGYIAAVDGGLFANNPSLEALSSAGLEDDGVLLLSLGTGTNLKKYSFENVWGWGLLGWANPLLEIAFSDPAIDVQIEQLMRFRIQDRYSRLQVDFHDDPLLLDDASVKVVKHLIARTEASLAEQSKKVTSLVDQLSRPRSPRCLRVGSDYERPTGPRKSQ
jgi:predicted acylesterase/phospholipase RssA